jgi:hypothetical protein
MKGQGLSKYFARMFVAVCLRECFPHPYSRDKSQKQFIMNL